MGIIKEECYVKNGEKFIIRTAETSDAEDLIEIVKKIDDENRYMIRASGEYKKSIQDMEEIIDESKNSSNSLNIVALSDDKIIGYLKFEGKNKARLRHRGEFTIGILKSCCGKGIGKKLMENMLNWCKDNSIIKVELKVAKENTRGIELYKKMGFRMVGELEKDLRLEDGEFLDFYLMDIIIEN